jgi:serine/threonine protein kinase
VEILDAVIALHEEGYAHLDLKLENIFLTSNYKPKLGDFGKMILLSFEEIP